MPKSKSKPQMKAAIPTTWRTDWFARLDKRTLAFKAANERITALVADAGGEDNLSTVRRSLIERAAWLTCLAESAEQQLAQGQVIDVGRHMHVISTLTGLYKTIGMERRAKNARTLADVMRGDAPPSPSPAPPSRPPRPPRAPVTFDQTAPAELADPVDPLS